MVVVYCVWFLECRLRWRFSFRLFLFVVDSVVLSECVCVRVVSSRLSL